MTDTNAEILLFSESRPRFKKDIYLKNEQEYLHELEDTAAWFSEQLKAYSENRTTKVELSGKITHKMLVNIELTIDSIVSGVVRESINPLRYTTTSTLRNVNEWYRQSLSAIPAVVPFYDDNSVEDKMRSLKVWMHPVARLETTDILQFKYPASESWRSWELSTTLEDFVVSGNATRIASTSMDQYSKILQSELTRIKLECEQAKEDTIVAIKHVIDDFQSVHVESLLESDFVLYVW